jgi:diaminohydroxyphosphoribosylaminopyrimidine deaminase/5-amino-6-(5-phosphoribosylamino)uracil reductase
MDLSDEHWMSLALAEARRGIGLTSPNPPVGAALVRDGALVGAGFHRKAGGPHAEIEALRDAAARGNDPRGCTAFVTLEPCSTHGRTPPCTDALVRAGVKRVVYGATDPNPDHAGAADEVLRAAGIEVGSGILQRECEEIIRPFAKWITTGLPYVIAKAATTLDGRLTRPAGESQWITGVAARAHAMHLRVRSDAILIGAETLRQDDPSLVLRGGRIPEGKSQPWRIVVTKGGRLPSRAKLFTDGFKHRTIVLRGDFSFREMLRGFAPRGIQTLLLEGGGSLLTQAFAARAVDEVCWYVAPRISGTGVPAVSGRIAPSVALTDVTHEIIGDDHCIHGRPVWE